MEEGNPGFDAEKNYDASFRKSFVNLPVKDVEKSKAFFMSLGFELRPDFTDENAACIKISDMIYIMLLTKELFSSFTSKKICDSESIEALLGINVASKQEVDDIFEKAIEAGGKEARETSDHGWMYGRSFEDLDGHVWEIFFMDEKSRNAAS